MNLVIISGKKNFFGQTRKPWVSIDTNLFISNLRALGANVEIMEFHKIANSPNLLSNSNILYTFSQKENLRNYILDLAFILQRNGNRIIPSYELLKCHENKGFQELHKNLLGINDFESYYFSSIEDLEKYDLKYPIVVKTVDGSNGKGVFLCNSKEEIISKISKFSKLSAFTKLDLFRRRYLRKNKIIKEYPDYSNYEDYLLYKDYVTPETRFIAQEFVPDQANDFRVLAIHDRYFVMKRHNRDGDFRASGSKKFDVDFFPDAKMLDKAKHIKTMMPDCPFLSMDFIFDASDDSYKLIEYQALHFGVSAILKNDGYYIKNNTWEKVQSKSSVEEIFALGIFQHLIKDQ